MSRPSFTNKMLRKHISGLHLLKQLALESRDLSQAEKKVAVAKPEKIHKLTIIFTHNDQKLSFRGKIAVIFKICSALATVIFLSS